MRKDLIFDLGFHNGDDTDFYLAKGFRVVAVEANPAMAAAGSRRFRTAIKNGKLVLLNKAVSDSRKTLTFYVHPGKSHWSSCIKEMAESDGTQAKPVKVSPVNIAELCAEYGVPRYIKVDVEGCDALAAGQIAGLKEKPAFVSFETSKKDYAGIFSYLYAAGYKRYQLVNQANNPARGCPEKTREGKTIKYRFGEHSTGYFGLDLPPAKWLSFQEALSRYLKYRELKAADNQELGLGWLDLHAGLE